MTEAAEAAVRAKADADGRVRSERATYKRSFRVAAVGQVLPDRSRCPVNWIPRLLPEGNQNETGAVTKTEESVGLRMRMHRATVPRRLATTLSLRAVVATLLLSTTAVLAQTSPAPAIAEDQRVLPYVMPGQLVDIGHRRINLQCSGSGGPTVILMAGIFSWSLVWYKTQPSIAQATHVCGFDRASYGFSDPAPRPQILSDVVDDLHAALAAASIPGPYVLVGHSLGGLEARLYTQRWPKEVAGMVLVDTSPAEQELLDEDQPDYDEANGPETRAAKLLKCALLALKGPLDPSTPEFRSCTVDLPSDTPAAFRAIWPQFFTAPYFAAKVSLMSSLYVHRYDSVDHLRLGAMPLVVLSAGDTWHFDNPTPAQVRFERAYTKIWIARQAALAHLSSRGVHRTIKGSSHDIELDKPQAIIDAVHEVLRELRAETTS
jgi:pimeloyl-ACP methyl ester carboxylesterase